MDPSTVERKDAEAHRKGEFRILFSAFASLRSFDESQQEAAETAALQLCNEAIS
jgi:hypothetical protein